MDLCADGRVDEIVIGAPAQIGKTVAFVENVIGYYLDQDPSDIMVVLADEDTAKYVSLGKVAPMFQESPDLAWLYDKKTFLSTEITTATGGRVDFAWATSVAKLATRPKRIVIADEVDKPGYYLTTKEASAMSLLRERTKSYPSGLFKHIFLSTPTTDIGNITAALIASDVIYDWHVPCRVCCVYQPLRWTPEYTYGFQNGTYRSRDGEILPFGRVVWDGGSSASIDHARATVRYECGSCGAHWTSHEKNIAVAKGVHVPRTPTTGKERRIGFHFNRLLSMMDAGKLENLVAEWLQAYKLPKELQVRAIQGFINSALAEPFTRTKRLENSTDSDILRAVTALPPQTVPSDAVALVAFVDVQKFGFWFVVRAFAADYRSWNIHHGFLSAWEDVETLFFDTSYPQEGRAEYMRIWRAGIDTGGSESRFDNASQTEVTYNWLRKNQRGRGCRVWGVKGQPVINGPESVKLGRLLDSTPSGKPLHGGLQLVLIDTFKMKTAFRARLTAAIEDDRGSRPAYLHSGTGVDYAKQILAEELVMDEKGVESWANTFGRANHLLDCEVGCMALADPEWPGGGINLLRRSSGSESPDQSPGRRIISRGINFS
jgi:phage terminase large subunit GpA-like protein